METTEDNDTVDEATAVRRQLMAACAAVDGIDIGEVLEVAARQQWELTPDQTLRGS